MIDDFCPSCHAEIPSWVMLEYDPHCPECGYYLDDDHGPMDEALTFAEDEFDREAEADHEDYMDMGYAAVRGVL